MIYFVKYIICDTVTCQFNSLKAEPMEESVKQSESIAGDRIGIELIKANCDECSFYDDCPRMRGESICYGKQEALSPKPSEEPDRSIK